MDVVIKFIEKVLGPIGIVVGLLVAIPVFLTWYELSLGRRRLKPAVAYLVVMGERTSGSI